MTYDLDKRKISPICRGFAVASWWLLLWCFIVAHGGFGLEKHQGSSYDSGLMLLSSAFHFFEGFESFPDCFMVDRSCPTTTVAGLQGEGGRKEGSRYAPERPLGGWALAFSLVEGIGGPAFTSHRSASWVGPSCPAGRLPSLASVPKVDEERRRRAVEKSTNVWNKCRGPLLCPLWPSLQSRPPALCWIYR